MRTRTMNTIPALAAAAVLALAGCSSPESNDVATEAPGPPASDAATENDSAAENESDSTTFAYVPSDCSEIAQLPGVQSALGDGDIELPDQAPPAEPGTTDELICGWDGENVNGAVTLKTVTSGDFSTYVAEQEQFGAMCAEQGDATRCESAPDPDDPEDSSYRIDHFEGQKWITIYSSGADIEPAFNDIYELVTTEQ